MSTITEKQIVREFSAYGPCIPLGELLRETAKFYVYDRANNAHLRNRRDREPIERKIAKSNQAIHLEPCRSCGDHEATIYPDGYQD